MQQPQSTSQFDKKCNSIDEIRANLRQYINLLETDRVLSTEECDRRAVQFLIACAYVMDVKRDFEERVVAARSVERAVYASAIQHIGNTTDKKNITEKKVFAESSDEYLEARSFVELSEYDIAFLRTHYEIFNNAHILYRQKSNGDKKL